jgi:hypothetical protein
VGFLAVVAAVALAGGRAARWRRAWAADDDAPLRGGLVGAAAAPPQPRVAGGAWLLRRP